MLIQVKIWDIWFLSFQPMPQIPNQASKSKNHFNGWKKVLPNYLLLLLWNDQLYIFFFFFGLIKGAAGTKAHQILSKL